MGKFFLQQRLMIAMLLSFSFFGCADEELRFFLSGQVIGLAAEESVSLSNQYQTKVLSADGNFIFNHEYRKGDSYDVAIKKFPKTQYCQLSNQSGTVMHFETSLSINCFSLPVLVAHFDQVKQLKLNADGTLLASASADKNLIIWQLDSFGVKAQMLLEDEVSALAFSANDRYLWVGMNNGKLLLWDFGNQNKQELAAHQQQVSQILCNAVAQECISAGMDSKLKVWKNSALELQKEISLPSGIIAVDWNPAKNEAVMALSNDMVVLWNTSSGVKIRDISAGAPVHKVVFSPDYSLIALAKNSNQIEIWSPESSSLFEEHQAKVSALFFTAEGEQIVSSSEIGQIFRWQISDRTLLSTQKKSYAIDAMQQYPAGNIYIANGENFSIDYLSLE